MLILPSLGIIVCIARAQTEDFARLIPSLDTIFALLIPSLDTIFALLIPSSYTTFASLIGR
jgi:hypothetical protein